MFILGVLGKCPGVKVDPCGVDGAAFSISMSSSAKLNAKDMVRCVMSCKCHTGMCFFFPLFITDLPSAPSIDSLQVRPAVDSGRSDDSFRIKAENELRKQGRGGGLHKVEVTK